jgi:hypothetical protein
VDSGGFSSRHRDSFGNVGGAAVNYQLNPSDIALLNQMGIRADRVDELILRRTEHRPTKVQTEALSKDREAEYRQIKRSASAQWDALA